MPGITKEEKEDRLTLEQKALRAQLNWEQQAEDLRRLGEFIHNAYHVRSRYNTTANYQRCPNHSCATIRRLARARPFTLAL